MYYKKVANEQARVVFYAPENQPQKMRMNLDIKTMTMLAVTPGKRFVRLEFIESESEDGYLIRILRFVHDPAGAGITIKSSGNGTLSVGRLAGVFRDGDVYLVEKCTNGIQFKY